MIPESEVAREVQFFKNVYGTKTINQIRAEVGQAPVAHGNDEPYFKYIARQMLLNWKPKGMH